MMKQPATFKNLISIISETDRFFKNQVQKQVNVALTLRNWLIGLYIVEYEQNGDDRAEYGEKLIERLSVQLKAEMLKGFSAISLRLYRSFYLAYPQIRQSLTVESHLSEFQHFIIQPSLTVESHLHAMNPDEILRSATVKPKTDVDKLINQLNTISEMKSSGNLRLIQR